MATLLRLVGLVILAGIGLTTAGGILGIQAHSNHNSAKVLREIGNILYAISYVCLFIAHVGTWTYRWHLRSNRRNVSLLILRKYASSHRLVTSYYLEFRLPCLSSVSGSHTQSYKRSQHLMFEVSSLHPTLHSQSSTQSPEPSPYGSFSRSSWNSSLLSSTSIQVQFLPKDTTTTNPPKTTYVLAMTQRHQTI